jgi:probable rRNA maturation factor
VRVHVTTRRTRRPVPIGILTTVGKAAMRAAGCPPRAELEVALVDDATIALLNQRFLGHRGATDVLTFPDAAGAQTRVLGEIVISVPRARQQARDRRHSIRREMALLLAHGVLHLRGYRDDTPRTAARMLARAEKIVTQALAPRRVRRPAPAQ